MGSNSFLLNIDDDCWTAQLAQWLRVRLLRCVSWVRFPHGTKIYISNLHFFYKYAIFRSSAYCSSDILLIETQKTAKTGVGYPRTLPE